MSPSPEAVEPRPLALTEEEMHDLARSLLVDDQAITSQEMARLCATARALAAAQKRIAALEAREVNRGFHG